MLGANTFGRCSAQAIISGEMMKQVTRFANTAVDAIDELLQSMPDHEQAAMANAAGEWRCIDVAGHDSQCFR